MFCRRSGKVMKPESMKNTTTTSKKKNSIKIPHKQPQPKHPIMCYPFAIPEKYSGIQCSIFQFFFQMVVWSIAKEWLFAFTANDIIALSLCSPFSTVVHLRNSHCFKRTGVKIEQIIIGNISFGLLTRSKESSILYAPLIDYQALKASKS